MKLVLGSGPIPCRFLLCGEGPGRAEAQTSIPFTGPSGKLLEQYLSHAGFPLLRQLYRTNLIKEYRDSNPDPTPEQILDWTPTLLEELSEVQPQIILAIGRYAARFFLGDSCPDMETIHGRPHRVSDLKRADLPACLSSSIIIPVFHPAGALWNYERRSIIKYGYELAGETLRQVDSNSPVDFRHDSYAGQESYVDVSGAQLASILSTPASARPVVGFDTEGTPDAPWSLQLSLDPGSGLLLRVSQPDFSIGVQALSKYLHTHRPTIAMHQASTPRHACYDVIMARAMGLELQGLPWFDTMYWAYLARLESQGNKLLCERWQGMTMEDYESTVGNIGRDKQIDYLNRALSVSQPFSKPGKRHEKQNTGLIKTSQPKHIHASITAILRDISEGKETKDGPTNPLTRWKGLRDSNPEQVSQVESLMGKMPMGTLDDTPLDISTVYACKDSDGTLRNALTFMSRDLTSPRMTWLMSEGMRFLPLIEIMQKNGMPVSISRISSLSAEMDAELDPMLARLSNTYWDGKPFNPASPKQVASLCRRLGIKPAIKTSTGQASTSKKSIEEFRYTQPAISLVFDCRERQHNRDTYCNDVLSRVPPNNTSDTVVIHANFRGTKIPSRRLAASDPNILGIPTRSILGRKVRECYVAPPGKIWCGYDLSGVEVRCLAHLSRDPLLINVFKNRINPHKDTAQRLFNLPSISDVTDLQKAVAKTINFLVIYGGGASNLYDQFRSNQIKGYDLDACRGFIRKWFSTYSGVDAYRRRVIAKSKHTETSTDHWGMVRHLPGINCGDAKIEGEEGRAAVSQEVQGLARGALRNALIWLYPRLQDLISAGELDPECLRLDMHDELIFLVNKGEEELLGPLVLQALTKHAGIELCVPIEAEEHYGYTWGELK